jgi:large subunit ribosomal protein L10
VLTRAEKEGLVTELREKLGRATSVFVADYRGLSVSDVNELRGKVRGEAEYRVVKNTLLRRAVAESDVASLAEHFRGPTAVAISYGDPVGLAKVLVDYAKQHEVFELRGGWLEGKALDGGEIATLATLPSLQELRATLAGLVQAPATKLVRLMSEPGGQLARLMEARRGALSESEGA